MITVDNRTGSKELLQYFPPGEACLGRLSYADFAFSGHGPNQVPWLIGVERKTIADLIACMESGRFAGHQLKGLVNTYNEVHLIVEGLFKADSSGVLVGWGNNKWQPIGYGSRCYMMRDIWLWLNTMTVTSGIRWLTTTNPRDTARFVSTLHRWWTWKEYEEHRSHLVPNTGAIAAYGNHSLVRRLASQLSGIGWDKSKHIEDAFDSVADMVSASESDWAQVEGVGKKLSRSIVNELKGES